MKIPSCRISEKTRMPDGKVLTDRKTTILAVHGQSEIDRKVGKIDRKVGKIDRKVGKIGRKAGKKNIYNNNL